MEGQRKQASGSKKTAGTGKRRDPLRNTRRKLVRLQSLLAGAKNLLIVLQDFPDPDALGAAVGLRELARHIAGMSCSMTFGGVVGRAENRGLVRYLDLSLLTWDRVDMDRYDMVGMVDTQPRTGNNAMTGDRVPDIVIDHHPVRQTTRQCTFHDIRSDYGATSTILYEYLEMAKVKISIPVATALLYGIRSDTQDLGRESSRPDLDALLALYPICNLRMLGRIEMQRVPETYYRLLLAGLRNALVCGVSVSSNLGELDNPDMLGEVADLLLRREGTRAVLCYGFFEERCLLSIRLADESRDAGRMIRRIVGTAGTGGGHKAMAGGQIEVSGRQSFEAARSKLERGIRARFFRAMGVGGENIRPLVVPEK